MNRRNFLATASGALLAAPSPQFVKSICSVIFPTEMPFEDQFAQAKNAGFDGIEIRMGDEVKVDAAADEVKRIGDAARKAKVTIASMWVSQPFSQNPLNSPDPEVRARGVKGVERAIEFATYLGCGALLLVPGRLGDGAKFRVGYEDTWKRFTEELGKLVPVATRAQVILTPENVWNKFLVSPLEMRAFVDQFHSPWLQTHFDIGNVMQFGYPQDWILTLGARIKRVHVKDYKLSTRAEQGRFVDLLAGDVNFAEVIAALKKAGYHGTLSPEYTYNPARPDQLQEISRSLDKILAMA